MPSPDVVELEVMAPQEGKPLVLKKRKDFLAASKSGHKGVASSLVIQMNPKPHYSPAQPPEKKPIRYGLTASKKTGNAVCRNRCKRRMRTLVDDYLAKAGQPGCDYILIARHNTASIKYDRLVKDFHYAMKRAHQVQSKGGRS